MTTTAETHKQDQDDFAAAFAGADEVKTEMTEDEAFGLTPEVAETSAVEAPAEEPAAEAVAEPEEAPAEPETAESGTAGDAGDDMQGAAPVMVVAIEPSENANTVTAEKDLQREKSWEGRLKAREAELKAREDAIAAREGGAEATAEATEPGAAAALESAAEQVESGDLTIEQALKGLSNDFGEDFAKMLGVLIKAQASEIASKTVDERVGEVNHKMEGMAGEIANDRARMHFESISDAHPDFMEVAQAPEFKEFIAAMDETQQAAANAVIEHGSAREINKLISSYKAASQPAKPEPDAEQESAMDDAEGVRTSGLKLPEKPSISDDYSAAWDQF